MSYIKKVTSESVGIGHPDKICDQIADSILDTCLKLDPNSHVACEVFASNHLIVIGGEITTKGYVDVVKTAWDVLTPLGYDECDFTILSNINKQSVDIANLVDLSKQAVAAGDQGIVFGYATNETDSYMPLPITIAHSLCYEVEKLINAKKLLGAKYDMKSQVCINYVNNKPKSIDSMLMSIQHAASANVEKIRTIVVNKVMIPLAKKYKMNTNFKKFVNAAGAFIIGGPFGDTGLTGRKIIVDTYGGASRHGGGAFSGKDYTKVDRTGAYFARYIAKNIVAAKLADRCEVQLGFNIGLPKPYSIFIDTFGTSKYSDESILNAINKSFNFDLNSIIKDLNMKKNIYKNLSVYGHFGKENLPWEKTNKVSLLKSNIK